MRLKLPASLLLAAAAAFAGTYALTPTAGVSALPDDEALTTPIYFESCDEAEALGAAPIYAGGHGFRTGLDDDKDGVACERQPPATLL
jgi:hypothetical protein